jgi:hypothetical protein
VERFRSLARLRDVFLRPEAQPVPPRYEYGLDDRVQSTWASIEAELRGDLNTLLLNQLRQSAARRVPIRSFRAGPVRGVVRLHLADGVTVLIEPDRHGDCSRLSLAVARGATAIIGEVRMAGDGVHLTAVRGGATRMRALVVGFDQGD